MKPRFSIGLSAGRRSDDAVDLVPLSSQLWSLAPSVRWPLLSWGRLRAQVEVQDARQSREVAEYELRLLEAIEDVENALVGVTREQQRIEALQVALQAERQALALATERYTGGLESFLSVLDAQRSVYAVEDQLVTSETQSATYAIALYKALGGGWTPEPTPR